MIEQLKKLAESATPGPWVCDWPADADASDEKYPDVSVWQGVEFTGKFINNIAFDNCVTNGNYIAAANPATIRSLIEVAEKMAEALANAKIAMQDIGAARFHYDIARDALAAWEELK